MAGVQAMFHQVKVTESHTDFLCFLWWPQGDVDDAPTEFRMTVHLFGGVSSPSIANFALRKTTQDNASSFPPGVTSTIMENFYASPQSVSGSATELSSLLSHQRTELRR